MSSHLRDRAILADTSKNSIKVSTNKNEPMADLR